MPFNSIFAWLIKRRVLQIETFRSDPEKKQKELFSYLIEQGKLTEWGKAHHYQEIQSYSDFQQRVPLQDYETIKSWIEKSIAGQNDVLWPGETKWFAKSSGTTSDRSKLIPVTSDSLENCHYKGGKDLLAVYYDLYEDGKIFNGKHLIVGGSAQINALSGESYLGDLSAIILKNLPWWVEMKRTPSREIALLSDWDTKIERMAESTMNEDVYSISGVPSWTLVLMQKIIALKGKTHIKEVWPNLELFLHGGVNFEPYREEFKRMIPDGNMRYLESYNASEGFFGIQDQKDSKELLLMLDYGIFYEFIPMDSYDGINSKAAVPLAEVKTNQNYAIVITTNGGLWRYIIGDTVQFTSLLPYRFHITGRTKSFINAFGEELIVDNTDKALVQACAATGASIRDYTAAPIYLTESNKGGHEWLIEFSTMPKDLEAFTATLDSALRQINSDYDAKRSFDLILLAPKIVILPDGSFEGWLKSKGKLGGQNKIPRLSNSRDIIDEILQELTVPEI